MKNEIKHGLRPSVKWVASLYPSLACEMQERARAPPHAPLYSAIVMKNIILKISTSKFAKTDI